MSDQVEVPFGDKNSETATLLLAAADELGLDPSVVKTSEGSFLVPAEVKDKAFPPSKSKKSETEKSESKEG